MKPFRFFAVAFLVTATIFIVSCNNADNDKKADETKTDNNSTNQTTTAPSGPSSVMTVRIKVADYDKWLPGYEGHDSVRLSYGLHNYVIARGIDDPSIVMVALKMDDVSKAKAFSALPDLKEAMKKGGVIGAPTMDYLETVMNDTAALQQSSRLMIKHKVKDWDAWKKSYDEHKQVRMDAGLSDRVIAHTNGDTHNVTVVFAVMDMAKAKAFIASKDLADKMKEAGVEGPPDIFFYNIVKKY